MHESNPESEYEIIKLFKYEIRDNVFVCYKIENGEIVDYFDEDESKIHKITDDEIKLIKNIILDKKEAIKLKEKSSMEIASITEEYWSVLEKIRKRYNEEAVQR